jgi:hypothetical protein
MLVDLVIGFAREGTNLLLGQVGSVANSWGYYMNGNKYMAGAASACGQRYLSYCIFLK